VLLLCSAYILAFALAVAYVGVPDPKFLGTGVVRDGNVNPGTLFLLGLIGGAQSRIAHKFDVFIVHVCRVSDVRRRLHRHPADAD
jgi:hypothetical protein